MHPLQAIAATLPAALTAGAASGGTGVAVAAASSSSLGTAGLIGGIATALATVAGIVMQYRKVSAENVPALRDRLERAEKRCEVLERERDVARDETSVAETTAYRYRRQIISLGATPGAAISGEGS